MWQCHTSCVYRKVVTSGFHCTAHWIIWSFTAHWLDHLLELSELEAGILRPDERHCSTCLFSPHLEEVALALMDSVKIKHLLLLAMSHHPLPFSFLGQMCDVH